MRALESATTTTSTGRDNRRSLLCDILQYEDVERSTIGTSRVLVHRRSNAQGL